jgi:hypothetical protein
MTPLNLLVELCILIIVTAIVFFLSDASYLALLSSYDTCHILYNHHFKKKVFSCTQKFVFDNVTSTFTNWVTAYGTNELGCFNYFKHT